MRRRGIATLLALLGATSTLAAAASVAAATTFTVTTAADSGAGSFRDAITQSNGAGGPDVIQFTVGNIIATSALPTVTDDVTILGQGSGSTVSGSSLQIASNATAEVRRLGFAAPFQIVTASGPPAPTAIRVRRRSDGVVTLAGNLGGANGAVELFTGGTILFSGSYGGLGPGLFEVPLSPAPSEGATVAATLTTNGGTSAFSTPYAVTDLSAPTVTGIRTRDADADGRVDRLTFTTSQPLGDGFGFTGIGIASPTAGPALGADTGTAGGDAAFDVLIPEGGIDTAVRPSARLAANPSAADPAGNQVQLQPSAVTAVDGAPPAPARVTATSATQLAVNFSEPVAAGTLALSDLRLAMGGVAVPLTGLLLAPDHRSAIISGGGWGPGVAGALSVVGPIADDAGNATSGTVVAKVAASPGDTTAPVLTGVTLDRSTACFAKATRRSRLRARMGAACRRQGATLSYALDAPATVTLRFGYRPNRPVASLELSGKAGVNTVRIARRMGGFLLRPRTYQLTLAAQDAPGNTSPAASLKLRVRR